MKVTASAPGSIMVTGEHAVVYGHPAIVAAVDQRAFVTIEDSGDDAVDISSSLGSLRCSLSDIRAEGPLRFVLACVAALPPDHGVKITTRSEIDPTLGFGSSAAITVATLGALARLGGLSADLHATALSIVRGLQGRGSGADLAASLHGGLLRYQLGKPPDALPSPPDMAVKYAGYKTPTGEVLAQVASAWDGRPVEELYTRMGVSVGAAIRAAQVQDWAMMAEALNDYQAFLAELGVSDPRLDALVTEGRAGAMAAKISGSGLGDCVLAFGAVPPGWQPVKIAAAGLLFHD